jgi:hypothetical protein
VHACACKKAVLAALSNHSPRPAHPDDVTDKSASVNDKLLARRQHCEDLRRVGNLLAKLQVGALGEGGCAASTHRSGAAGHLR